MIAATRIRDALRAIRILRQIELDSETWQTVASLVAELALAARTGDPARLTGVLAQIERVGASRSAPLAPPTRSADDPEAAEAATRPAPTEVEGLLGDAAAELERAAAEVRRTPHVDISPKPPLRPGVRFGVAVYLDTTPMREDETGEDLIIEDPPEDLRELTVDVWLRATSHFVIDGTPVGQVVVKPHEERSTSATFRVRVKDPVPDVGRPALEASFDYNLRASGLVRRAVAIELDDAVLGQHPPAEIETAGARIEARAVPPDLEIVIHRLDGRRDRYDVLLRSHLLGGVVQDDVWTLDEESDAFVAATMREFVASKASQQARQTSLRGAGLVFFEAAPPRFRELYWRLLDAGTPPKTVYLVSEERDVPWELMIPDRPGSGARLPPLGVQCAIGRWHREELFSPAQHVPLNDSLVLAPEYTGGKRLAHAATERDYVLRTFNGRLAPDTFDALDAFYRANSASLLHFVCHGKDDTIQAILLRNGEVISATQLRASGLGDACRARRPFVFLNACEVGRPGRALAGVGGFPASFIAAEASAVIAPLWAVQDTIAHTMAKAFYDEVVHDPTTPFAEILRRLRERAYGRDGDDTFAAYCFYGDPAASAAGAA
jgi:hypothetical protein